MLNLGLFEIMFIVALALVVIGPERLPEVLRFLGRQYGKLMRTSNELRRAFMLEAERADIEKRAAAMRQRREEARQRIAEQRAKAEANDKADPEVEAVGVTGNPFGPTPPAPAAEAAEAAEAADADDDGQEAGHGGAAGDGGGNRMAEEGAPEAPSTAGA